MRIAPKVAERVFDSQRLKAGDLLFRVNPEPYEMMLRQAKALGSEIGHQLNKEFRAGKLDGIDFQSVPTDETQEAGYGFRRLDAAWAALEQTKADGQNTDAENESGEMELRKRVFPLFLPDVNDRSDDAGQEPHQPHVLCHRAPSGAEFGLRRAH